MKKLFALLLTIAMIFVAFAGCAGPGQRDTDDEETAEVPTPSGFASSGNPVTDSYTVYTNAKSVVIGKITDGLSNNPDTSLASMSMLGITMADLGMIPAAFFGLGQEAAAAGLAMLGAEGVQYTENGNNYTITYKDSEGSTSSMTGTWDAAAESLVCTGTTDGVENFYSEYHKTSYGYIGQYYFAGDDGSNMLYAVTIQGEDGYVGISTVTEKPAALTGSEPVDYPSACDEWYAVNGSKITGKMSDGTEVNFEYVPSESATLY